MILLIDALDSFTYNQGSRLRDTAKRGRGSTGLDVLCDRRDLLKPGGQQ
jgi:anthranilate/para-aminobenzoate synthase component II